MSMELIERVDQIINKAGLADRHSYFQLEKFVIGKEVTVHAQIWQIVRELSARRDTIDSLEEQLADAEDQLELFEVDSQRSNLKIESLKHIHEEEEDPQKQWYAQEMAKLEIQECEINIRKVERKRDALALAARKINKKRKYILEEMNYLIAAFDKCLKVAGEVKSLDDREAQKEMWNEKFLEEFNLRVLLKRPMDTEFIRSVMALDDDSAVKQHVVELLSRQQEKMLQDYHNKIETERQIAEANKKAIEQATPKIEGKPVSQQPKPKAMPPRPTKEVRKPAPAFVPEHKVQRPRKAIVGSKKKR